MHGMKKFRTPHTGHILLSISSMHTYIYINSSCIYAYTSTHHMLNEEISCQQYFWDICMRKSWVFAIEFFGVGTNTQRQKADKASILEDGRMVELVCVLGGGEGDSRPEAWKQLHASQGRVSFQGFCPFNPFSCLLKYAITKVRPQYPQYYVICPSSNLS